MTNDQSALPMTTKALKSGRPPAPMTSSIRTRMRAERDRLGDGIDEEQDRIGPVRLHLPAEAGRYGEAAQGRRMRRGRIVLAGSNPPHAGAPSPSIGASEVVTASAPRAALPGGRAVRGRRVQRASQQEDDGHRDEDQRLDLRAGCPERVRGIDERELAHRIEADGERQDRDRQRAERPRAGRPGSSARTRSRPAR